MKHKFQEIAIKKAEVDELLIPIVNWLNSFDDIHTRFCCENEPPEGPFIIFFCESALTLCTVLKKSKGFASCKVEFYDPAGSLRYSLSFKNKEIAALFAEHIDGLLDLETTDKIPIVEADGVKYPSPK
jgi:hypothetical protein